MKILIMTLGTRGDVEPYVALGRGLQRAGHEVSICTAERFESFVTQHGIPYVHMDDSIIGLIDSEEVRALMGNVTNLWGAIRAAMALRKQVPPLQKMMIKDTGEAALSVKPDLIIFHPKTYGATHFAEKLGIPSILAPTLTQFVPTGEFSGIGFPKLPLGRVYNRFTYQMTVFATVSSMSAYTNPWRKEHGLKPYPRTRDFMLKQAGEPIPVIHPVSPLVSRVPSDWPDHIHAEGYWFLESNDPYEPPADLKAFLETGDPPVYVGFGSMVGIRTEELTKTVIEGIKKAGVRAILATGWGGLTAEDLPDTIFILDRAPHRWLFPQMAAVVHHGGAGTTAAGILAQKPTFISWFFGDQPYWGERIHELGIGPEPIGQKKLTPENFAAAVTEMLTNTEMQRKAAELGEKLAQEDGVGNAVKIINDVLKAHYPEVQINPISEPV